jgi:predicted DNA-binding antitoxin AbrB/MazE fold protein
MPGLDIEAIYVNGVLKLPRELPLLEGQKVTITIHPPGGVATRAYGRLQSLLGPEDLEQAALDPELGLSESS